MGDAAKFGVLWLLFAGAPAIAQAAEAVREAGNIGVGLGGSGFGVGIASKWFMNENNALQGVIAPRNSGTTLLVDVDYLYNFSPIRSDESVTIGWYAGFGGALGLGATDFVLGVNGVLGGDFDIDVVPLDIFVEFRPMLELATDTEIHFTNFGAGVRYYF